VNLRDEIEQIKRRRRSVAPDKIHALLLAAGFEYRWGGRNHAIYSHTKLVENLSIKQSKPLKPTYVSQAIRALEEVLDDENS
jgi:hypothetical protein